MNLIHLSTPLKWLLCDLWNLFRRAQMADTSFTQLVGLPEYSLSNIRLEISVMLEKHFPPQKMKLGNKFTFPRFLRYLYGLNFIWFNFVIICLITNDHFHSSVHRCSHTRSNLSISHALFLHTIDHMLIILHTLFRLP